MLYFKPENLYLPRKNPDEVQQYKRWYTLRHNLIQQRYWLSNARYNIVRSGRRSGKTELAKRKVAIRALSPPSLGGSAYNKKYYFLAAPTRDQAKTIFWDDIKKLIPQKMRSRDPYESALILLTKTNAEIHIIGMDKPQRIEGTPWDGGVLDEYGNMKSQAWTENVRPALADRQGWCDFIGVPEGKNHYYELYKKAQSDETGTWAAFRWKSEDILTEHEIEQAKHDLDELTFLQEMEGEFVSWGGLAYYNFDENYHVGDFKKYYNKEAPLIFCFDFNVNPGVAVVVQEMVTEAGEEVSVIVGEVFIRRNSTTPAICRKLIKDWRLHRGIIICYGDATGGAKGSAKVRGSDWDLIKAEFKGIFGDRVYYHVPRSNPRERARINSVNSRLMSAHKDVRLIVDKRCRNTIKDFENTTLLEGGAGEIDKKKNMMYSHMTDSLGYYVCYEFPIIPRHAGLVETTGL